MTPAAGDLWFLPLGGCGEIGINCSLYGHDGAWLAVDCGVGFERGAGRTRVIAPRLDFIAARRDRLCGLLITHAHEDHVGAVADLWPELRCQVYCTAFTAQILRHKLAEADLLQRVPVQLVAAGERQQLGPFSIEWLNVTHSTPESQALLIRTAAGTVFHTGDWKLDPDPLVGAELDRAAFARLGREDVLAMVCDSTNALVEGRSASEGELFPALHRAVLEAPARVVVGCFGSNIARLHTLMKVAEASGRYAGLLGRSLRNYYRAARDAGLWRHRREFIVAEHLAYLPRAEVLAVATGSQGEPGSALPRLAAGNHHAFDLEADDTVIMSARVIPGNEELLDALYRRLRALGVRLVLASEMLVHASGHPAREELRTMYRWVRPRFAVPVHGEAAHLAAHGALARDEGIGVLEGRNGDLFRLAPQPSIRRGAAATGRFELRR